MTGRKEEIDVSQRSDSAAKASTRDLLPSEGRGACEGCFFVFRHDNGVSGLVFDNRGDLHVQVARFTSSGHNQADSPLGRVRENPFSGASLVADAKTPGTRSHIRYKLTANTRNETHDSADVLVLSPR